MQDIWSRIEAQFRRHIPKPEDEDDEEDFAPLTPGASEDEIIALESQIGRRLPEDFRQSLAIHDGISSEYAVPSGTGLLSRYVLSDIEQIGRDLAMWRELLLSGEFEERGEPRAPTGPVERTWWSMGWVPITENGSGNHLCIDLDPPAGGSFGQVFDFGHEEGPTRVFFPDFRGYLEYYAAALESGAIRFDEDSEEWIIADGPAA